MVSKDVTFSSGANTSFSSELNQTIMQPLSVMDSTDNTSVSCSGASPAYATKRTLTIDASQISNYVIIRGNLRSVANNPGSNVTTSVTGYLQLTIDGTQVFEKTCSATSGVAGFYNMSGFSETWCYKYTPTADEKANGFTIDLDLKQTASVPNDGTTYNDNWEVWGA